MTDHAIHARDAAAAALPRGLPGPLPEGETLLWQGAPDWWSLARRALHVHQLMVYFAILLAWAIGSAMWAHGVFSAAVLPTLVLVPLAAGAVAALALYAWAASRTTHYTITNRRVVISLGVALPMTVNIPFRQIISASVTSGADRSGDIALALGGGDRLAYAVLWPHVRPWHLKKPQPALRGVADVVGVSRLLANALAASMAPSPVPAAVPVLESDTPQIGRIAAAA